MKTRFASLFTRALLGLFVIMSSTFFSFGSAFAEAHKPDTRVDQVAEEASDATGPIAVSTNNAAGEACTFQAMFAVMSNSSIRAIFDNVSGNCDGVHATGRVAADGYDPIAFDEQVRNAAYPGIKLGTFKDLPYDNVTVYFQQVKLGSMELPDIGLLHKHAPVHVWVDFPEYPKLCVVDGTFKNDPGIVVTDNGQELKREWYSADAGSWGPIKLSNGDHNLKIETYRPKNGKQQWEQVNQVLTTSFTATGCDQAPPPATFNATPSINCMQDYRVDVLTQENVASVEWSVNGNVVAEPKGNLGDAQSVVLKARVVGTDGKETIYTYTINRSTDTSCQPVFEAHPTITCTQDWNVLIDASKNVESVEWSIDGKPLAGPSGNLGSAMSATVKATVHGIDGSTKEYAYQIKHKDDPTCNELSKAFAAEPGSDCFKYSMNVVKAENVAKVVWSVNGQPVSEPSGEFKNQAEVVIRADVTFADGSTEQHEYRAQRQTGCTEDPKIKVWSTNLVECAQLPYSSDLGLIKYKTFSSASNIKGEGDWRLMYGEYSLDGVNWTRFEGKRFGFDPRAGSIQSRVGIRWTVGSYDNGAFTGKTETHRQDLPSFDPADESTWKTFEAVLSWKDTRFLRAGKPETMQAIRDSIAACTPKTPPPPPITVCIKGADGQPQTVTYEDGRIPEGVEVLDDCTPTKVLDLSACVGYDAVTKRQIIHTFTVQSEEDYERVMKEQANRCRPAEAAGDGVRARATHAQLQVGSINAGVVRLESGQDFNTSQAAEHSWNQKRIVSLHYFGKGRTLERVQMGDVITWTEGGNVIRYRVTNIKIVAFNGAEYGDPESLVADNGIMLMTCYRPSSATHISQTLMVIGERLS